VRTTVHRRPTSSQEGSGAAGKCVLPGAPEPQPLIPVADERLRSFCERWAITELAIFGSVARGEVREGSDLDLLVTFAESAHPGLDIIEMELQLQELLGRPVDLVTRKAVERSENPLRKRQILSEARPIFAA